MKYKYKYKNLSGVEQIVIGFGKVGAKGYLHTNELINNPNFELVSGKKTEPEQAEPEKKETKTKEVKK